jgi:hypothetical protein
MSAAGCRPGSIAPAWPWSKARSPAPAPRRSIPSPRPGFLSADTWTLIGTYLRNLLLNWLVLLPLIAAALMFPRLSTALLLLMPDSAWATGTLIGVAQLCGWVAIGYAISNRPSLCEAVIAGWPAASRVPAALRTQGWFLALCLLPLWLCAVSSTTVLAWAQPVSAGAGGGQDGVIRYWLFGLVLPLGWACVAYGAALAAGGFLLSRVFVWNFGWRALREGAAILAVGLCGGLLLWAVSSGWPGPCNRDSVERYVCFGAPAFLAIVLVVASVFVGLTSRLMDDDDREWLARAGSWVLILIVVRAAVSAVVIFGPHELVVSVHRAVGLLTLGGLAGLATSLLGGGAATPATAAAAQAADGGPSALLRLRGAGLALAVPTFLVALLAALSLGTNALTRAILLTWPPASLGASELCGAPSKLHFGDVQYYTPWPRVLLVAALFLAVGGVMGLCVNINRFSLHAAYRDRLIRAYLGASRLRWRRKANPFTGFDPRDNLEMRELRGNRPLPLLNVTLNLVAGEDLAWQDRKAEPFSITPLHAGSFRVGYRDAADYGWDAASGKAISLGTAMAISGAAASPNMGYHSSPLVTFLLTLFNVRLGWWLGNPGPRGEKTYRQSGPLFAPRPLFSEAFGRTDDRNPYVYLSDGGHFENLGLYEMVLRRCRHIVVGDATQDPELSFDDLGSAISRIRTDLGVPIVFKALPMRPRSSNPAENAPYGSVSGGEGGGGGGRGGRGGAGEAGPAPYCAVGRICYSCIDGAAVPDGYLILVKASLNGSEPVDVFQYAKGHPRFPYEPTEDEFYSEAQFESYRALGSHIMETVLSGLESWEDLPRLAEVLLAEPQRKA